MHTAICPSSYFSNFYPNSIEHQLRELALLAQCETATFSQIEKQFIEIAKSTNLNKKVFSFDIKDFGEEFYKTLLMMSQFPQLYISSISNCHIINYQTDGFTRELIIPDAKQSLKERVFINQPRPHEATVIFVKTDNKDHEFAGINQVYQQGGKWYWTGTYLYSLCLNNYDFKEQFTQITNQMHQTLKVNNFNSLFQELIKNLSHIKNISS